MGKIIQFPKKMVPPNALFSEQGGFTRSEVIEMAEKLIWEDPEAFYSLEANCLAEYPLKMGVRVQKKLLRMGLVDRFGYSPSSVRAVFREIAKVALESRNRAYG